MRSKKLQTRRKIKTGFRTLFAQTKSKKQHASTISDVNEAERDVPEVGIGKSLTVILILHIVAIAAICIGTNWRGTDSVEEGALISKDGSKKIMPASELASKQEKFRVTGNAYQDYKRNSQLSNQGKAGSVKNYEKLPEVLKTTSVAAAPLREPKVIRPKKNPNAQAVSNRVKYKTHKIVPGDTIYRIAMKNKAKPEDVLSLNNIADARKIRVGMVIKVPIP